MTDPEIYSSIVPLFVVLVSLAAVPLIILSRKFPDLRETWTIAASLIKFGLVLSMLPQSTVE